MRFDVDFAKPMSGEYGRGDIGARRYAPVKEVIDFGRHTRNMKKNLLGIFSEVCELAVEKGEQVAPKDTGFMASTHTFIVGRGFARAQFRASLAPERGVGILANSDEMDAVIGVMALSRQDFPYPVTVHKRKPWLLQVTKEAKRQVTRKAMRRLTGSRPGKRAAY
jgi:hypothetical protein